jgi:AcrR family transcriptional regulator
MQARLDRQQAQSDSRRKGVLDAARVVFERLGIEGASIREIAKEAGYTAGAIYSYFENKEAIYGALLAESLERLNAAVDAAGQTAPSRPNCWRPRPAPGSGFSRPTRATWTWAFTWCRACARAGSRPS